MAEEVPLLLKVTLGEEGGKTVWSRLGTRRSSGGGISQDFDDCITRRLTGARPRKIDDDDM